MQMKRALLISLNTPGYYNLAIPYLKLYAAKDAALMRQCRIYSADYDLNIADRDILNNISKLRPDLTAFSCYVWNITKALSLARAVKFLLPETKVVFGGQEVTNSTIDYLERYPFLDVIVDGEGEESFYQLLQSLVGDDLRSLEKITGIQYRCGNSWMRNGPAGVPVDLDRIPSPYLENAVAIPQKSPLGVMIDHVRGCPAVCAFCFEALRARRPRAFSLDRVKAELEWALARGYDYFHLMDPVLAMNDPSRLASLRSTFETARQNNRFRISVEIYAENVNPDNWRLFDCYQVFDVGLQTINPSANRAIHRRFRKDAFVAGFELLKRLNQRINLYLIYGLPGDDYREFMKGVCFADSLGAYIVFLNKLCVLDGTPLRRDSNKFMMEYNQQPPYEIISNATYSYEDVAKSESFARSYMRYHGAGKPTSQPS